MINESKGHIGHPIQRSYVNFWFLKPLGITYYYTFTGLNYRTVLFLLVLLAALCVAFTAPAWQGKLGRRRFLQGCH